MAKRSASPQPAPQPAAYEPSALYRVRLSRPVSLRGLKFLPRDAHVMRGDFITAMVSEVGDVVSAAERV